ncbi:hypothetical protein EDB92DRAFT_1881231 [Lactarius akahatsu]|uniref:Uncharacterized protein n=1 Tax=Lactarius akahatsu TaxID=416441 RepID=A0AAD4LCB1_9AGAM|nr:hypothetical protein EDB92DRAFT_1881231 [Lactarius akahatsu]
MLQILKQYDADDTRTMMHLELILMFDSLGSASSTGTTGSFFTRSSKHPQTRRRASELHGHEHQTPNLHAPGTPVR